MDNVPIWMLSILLLLCWGMANAEENEVKQALVQFMSKLSPGNAERDQNWGWNMSSDPCTDNWAGVTCDKKPETVRKIVLDEFNFTGILDAASLCTAKSLAVLSLNKNHIIGGLPEEISNCKRLTHLFISGNRFSGRLPDSISQLSNLKRLVISYNYFSGELPDLPRISGLITFFAENNQLSGEIPDFDFSNLQQFNVSNNEFSGPVPDVHGRFTESSFSGNSDLCGKLLSKTCPPAVKGSKKSSRNQVLIYSGYLILGLIVVLFLVFKLVSKNKPQNAKLGVENKKVPLNDSSNKFSGTSSYFKTGGNRSEYSIPSTESGAASSPLVVLTSPVVKGLRFEDFLRAPAELLGRGKHGSLYKVMLDGGVSVVVKRIKEWGISNEEFKSRMERIDRVKHRNVLPLVAFYCSNQEKLLVYEYLHYGSLFNLLHGTKNGQPFDWGSRISLAATIAEALAFMHKALCQFQIPHGNLKSTNILLNKNMEACISEYGLMVAENQDQTFLAKSEEDYNTGNLKGAQAYDTFKVDIYGFGVILLELLTGKLVQNNGFDLATWVHSVVREEWTVEVFDKTLISEGANEERMVNLLQVALMCINPSPNERPSIDQVLVMINTIMEEEERSISSKP